MLWEALLPPSEMGNPARMITGVDGYELTFADGNQAICLTSGLWNVNFGYGNRFVADHIDQVCSKLHYATLFRHSHPDAHEVAERMLQKVGWPEGAVVLQQGARAISAGGSRAKDQKGDRHCCLCFFWSFKGRTVQETKGGGCNKSP